MKGKEEDVKLGASKFSERQPIGKSAQTQDEGKDYKEPPPAPLFEPGELTSWSFYRARIAEFIATFLFLYITILTVMRVVKSKSKCTTVEIQGIAWAFGRTILPSSRTHQPALLIKSVRPIVAVRLLEPIKQRSISSDKSPNAIKSPRNFQEGVVGLGIVAAMIDLGNPNEVALSDKSPRSNPIPIVSAAKPAANFRGGFCVERAGAVVDESAESYTCVITHFRNNLTSKRVFDDELSGVVDDPNAGVVEAFSDVVFYKSVFPCNSGGRVWTRSIKLFISSSPLPYDGGKGEQKHRQVQFCGSAQQVALAKQIADEYIYSQLVQQPGAQQPVLQ
ncbi:hypothetical protein TB2_006286 [Malus domestica]